MALAISTTLFIAVAAAILLFGYRRYVVAGRLYQSLARPVHVGRPLDNPANPDFFSVSRMAEAVGRKLPPSVDTASALQLKLISGGYRQQNAVAVFYGLKLISMAVVTLVMILFELNSNSAPLMKVFGIAVGIFAGFKLPDYFLSKRVNRRKKRLRKALPDALDMIVICAEAGLTIDRAFKNVSLQMARIQPELCDEFNLFNAEISAGLRRREALENLATRAQEPEIRKFVAVLTQADRFGTSMADALRTHAEYLRVRRRQDAEERASKVGVKLIFPIFFFIMPCMLLVTMGPAALTIMRQLSSVFGGGQ